MPMRDKERKRKRHIDKDQERNKYDDGDKDAGKNIDKDESKPGTQSRTHGQALRFFRTAAQIEIEVKKE